MIFSLSRRSLLKLLGLYFGIHRLGFEGCEDLGTRNMHLMLIVCTCNQGLVRDFATYMLAKSSLELVISGTSNVYKCII